MRGRYRNFEVRQAVAERSSAELRLDAALAALTSGRENLRVIEARYAQGIAQMTDLLDAQTRYVNLKCANLRRAMTGSLPNTKSVLSPVNLY
ncbi:MAG: TolC family protein [bacterium]|nr:TolC family protein [bacterium]